MCAAKDPQLDHSPAVPVTAAIALGANLGDCGAALRTVTQEIAALPQTKVTAQASFYRTAPIESSGPDYLNTVLLVATTLAPRELLHHLQRLELKHGRVRPAGVINAPRTMDLDVLTYGDLQSKDPELTLPHPRMHLRAFVLVPLVEIAPDFVIPGKGRAADFLPAVADQRIEKL